MINVPCSVVHLEDVCRILVKEKEALLGFWGWYGGTFGFIGAVMNVYILCDYQFGVSNAIYIIVWNIELLAGKQ